MQRLLRGSGHSQFALRNFYEREYLRRNPSQDIGDVPEKIEHIMSVIPQEFRPRVILDVGCGSGKALDDLVSLLEANCGAGCDLSFNSLLRAKEHVQEDKISLINADASHLPFRIGSVDFAYLTDLIEHLPFPQGFVGSAISVSKILVLTMPLESGMVSDLSYGIMTALHKETNLQKYGHIWRFSRKSCLGLLASATKLRPMYAIRSGKEYRGNSMWGRFYSSIVRATKSISPRLHELLFGGKTMVILYVNRGSQ